jgi:hypothetical protein
MSNLNDILAEAHEALATELLRRIKSGEASATDLNVARQFLKDNGIEALPTAHNPIGNLLADLPFPSAQELN